MTQWAADLTSLGQMHVAEIGPAGKGFQFKAFELIADSAELGEPCLGHILESRFRRTRRSYTETVGCRFLSGGANTRRLRHYPRCRR